MRNASGSPRSYRRPFTNRLAVAALLATGLLTGILTAGFPVTGAMAVEATPTAGATVSATAKPVDKAAEKSEVVSVGAGTLIALSDIALFEADGAGVVGSLEAGESADWARIDDRPTPPLYIITTDAGLEASVSADAVYAFPKDGQKLDKPIVIKSGGGDGKADPLSGWGGKLQDTLVIRDAPSRKGEVIAKLQAGQKFPQASAPAEGESTVMGTSIWVTVLLDAETKEYGFIHSAATAIDKNPDEPEVLEASPTNDDDEQSESTAVATETETAAVTASAAAVIPATEAPRPGTVDAAEGASEEKADGNLVVIGGLGAVVALLIGGGVVAGKRKKKKVAAEDDVDDDTDAKPAKKVVEAEDDADSETVVAVEAAAEPEAEDIDWNAED